MSRINVLNTNVEHGDNEVLIAIRTDGMPISQYDFERCWRHDGVIFNALLEAAYISADGTALVWFRQNMVKPFRDPKKNWISIFHYVRLD